MSIPRKIQRLFQAWGKQGGRKRARRLTSQRRQAIASKAARSRWRRRKSKS